MNDFQIITDLIKKFSTKHLDETKESFHITENASILTKEIPSNISSLLSLNDGYRVKGSVGNGNWSEIPWLAILDKDITTSTTRGYYITLLFNREIESFFLVLSMGWTQFEEEFGSKDGLIQSKILSERYASMLNSHNKFKSGPIDLGANNNLGKGYEKGVILSKEYQIDSLDGRELREDIVDLLEIYRELKMIVGDSILNLEIDISENNEYIKEFKKEVAKKSLNPITEESIKELVEIANSAPVEIKKVLRSQILRNRKFAVYAKERANYICEICGRKPFIQKNGKPYAEADHIEPISNRKIGLDSPDNLRCLCAQCHVIVTHGSESEINNLFL